MIYTLLVILLVLLILGVLPEGPVVSRAGYWPGGIVGVVLVILLILLLLGRI